MFIAHLVVGLAITNSSAVHYLGGDAFTYHNGAIDLVRYWTDDFPFPVLPSGKEGFFYLLGALYWLFGFHSAAGLAVNAMLAAALAPLIGDIARRMFGAAAARYVPPLLLLPGLFLWTSQLLREAGTLFCIVLAACCAVRLTNRASPAGFATLATSLAALFTFRGYVAFAVAGALICGIALSRRQLVAGVRTGLTIL
ncbi:MAG: hypothetical protein M3450_00175, partial [Actinomycetota bacterium]|nr:hypothetical protein [Actinomycetota bacterium]